MCSSSTNTRWTMCSTILLSTSGRDRPSQRNEYLRGRVVPHFSSATRMTSSIECSTNWLNSSRVMEVLNLLDDNAVVHFMFPSRRRLGSNDGARILETTADPSTPLRSGRDDNALGQLRGGIPQAVEWCPDRGPGGHHDVPPDLKADSLLPDGCLWL